MPEMAHEASMRDFHFTRSWAHLLASSQVRPLSRSSFSMDLRQVSLGLPLLHFPWGIHRRAVLGSVFCDIRRTCPSHLHLLHFSSVDSGTASVLVILLIILGQYIFFILLRHFVWKVSSFLQIDLVILHPSSPHRSMLMTSDLKIPR